MKNELLIYIPSESKAASNISMKSLLGIPLFLRGILTLGDAGFKGVTLVAPASERRPILKAWSHHVRNKDLRPHFIWTSNNHKVDAKNFADIVQNSENTVTILNANLLITKDVFKSWQNITLKKGQHLKAVIDRGLAPMVRCTIFDLDNLKERVTRTPLSIEDMISELLKKTTPHPASSKWTAPVKLVTPFTDRSDATHFLTEQIRTNTPTWVARNINKRISLPMSVILAKLRVRPNTITMVNMLIGMGASIGAAGRTYTGLLIGAILFQLASIVDGCDGEVAKLTHRSSKFGQYIDSISDNFALAGFITGLMIHEYRVSDHDPMALVWGAALLIGFFTTLGIMISFLKKNTDSASFVTFDKEYLAKLPSDYPRPVLLLVKYGKYALKKDFFSFIFLVFAILGILPWMLYISAVGAWIGIAVLGYLRSRPHFATIRHSCACPEPFDELRAVGPVEPQGRRGGYGSQSAVTPRGTKNPPPERVITVDPSSASQRPERLVEGPPQDDKCVQSDRRVQLEDQRLQEGITK